MTNLLREARAAMGGLADIDTVIRRVKASMLEARRRGMDPDTAIEDALETVLAGGEIPPLGEDYVARRRRYEVLQASVARHEALLAALQHRRRQHQIDHVNDGLGYLTTQLDAVLFAARTHLDNLTGVATPQGAIDSGQTDSWTAAQTAAARYEAIRETQRLLVQQAIAPSTEADGRQTDVVKAEARSLVDLWGTVKNYPELYPTVGWWEYLHDVELMFYRPVPKTTPNGTAIPAPDWLTGDPLHRLRVICSDGIQAWLPTLEQMQEARAAHFEQRRQAAIEEAQANPPKKRQFDPVERGIVIDRRTGVPGGINF